MLSDLPSSPLTVRQRLTIGFGLLAVVGSMLASWLWWRSLTADHLISLTPLESVIYFHARRPVFSDELGLSKLDQVLQARFSFSAPVLFEGLRKKTVGVDEVSTFATIGNKGQLDWTVCVRSRSVNPAGFFLDSDTAIPLTPQVACASSSSLARQLVENTAAGVSLSLASQLPAQRRTNRQIFFVLKPRELAKLSDHDLYTKGSQLLPPLVSGGARVQASDVMFDFDQPELLFKAGQTSQVPAIPDGTSLTMSGITPSTLMITLMQVDPAWRDYLVNLRQSLAGAPQPPTTQLHSLLDQPATLMVRFSSDQVNQPGVLVELSTQGSEVLTQLEQFLAFLLARAVPQEAAHVLPDGTSVTELSADPQKLVWQNEHINSNTVRTASSFDGQHQLMYTQSAGRLRISTDRELLDSVLRQSGQATPPLLDRCQLGHQFRSVLMIRLQELPASTLSGWLVLGSTRQGNVSGCLTEE